MTEAKWPDGSPDESAFTDLDRFPATLEGHVDFLDSVCDQFRSVVEAKQAQAKRGDSGVTIETLIRGIKWDEARARLRALRYASDVPNGVRSDIDELRRLELSADTIGQIDTQLDVVVGTILDSMEESSPSDDDDSDSGDWYVYFQPFFNEFHFLIKLSDEDEAKRIARIVRERVRNEVGCACFVHAQRIDARTAKREALDYQIEKYQALARSGSPQIEAFAARVAAELAGWPLSSQEAESGDFIDRLLSGPVDAELLLRELALLDAYLKQPDSLAEIQRKGKVMAAQAEKKLRLIRDFNHNLRSALSTHGTSGPAGMVDSTGDAKANSAGEAAPVPTNSFLGGAALADALGIHATRRIAFFRRLDRERLRLGDECWHEVRDPRPNSPRFLYSVDALTVRRLAAAYTSPKPA